MFSPATRDFLERLRTHLHRDAWIYLFIGAYSGAGLVVLLVLGATDRSAHALYFERGLFMFGIAMPAIALSADALWTCRRFWRRKRLALTKVFSPARLARFVAGMLVLQAMTLFFGTFTSIKNVLPLLHGGGFPFDTIQADIDRTLHFGVDPWRLMQPMLENDTSRSLLEWNYNVGWFIVCYGVLFFVVTSPRARAIRSRYLLGFMLVWIVVGNALAGLFLSAGPAFHGFVAGDAGRFADQIALLAQGVGQPHSAASYQAYLWTLHESGRSGFGSGISAFPSVHVALISFNAFMLFAWSRRLGALAFAYVALVQASSVALGWHYAIDGYAGFAVAGLLAFGLRGWSPGALPTARTEPQYRPAFKAS